MSSSPNIPELCLAIASKPKKLYPIKAWKIISIEIKQLNINENTRKFFSLIISFFIKYLITMRNIKYLKNISDFKKPSSLPTVSDFKNEVTVKTIKNKKMR